MTAGALQETGKATGTNPEGAREAVTSIGTVCLFLLIFALLFPAAALGAFRVWVDSPTFNHCFIIVPLVGFLIWQRRATLSGTIPNPNLWGVAITLGLAAVWLVAFLIGILEAQQFIIMTMVQATLFGAFGFNYYRKLVAPFLYLYFLVPSGAYLIPVLQLFTARFAVTGLHLLGIPVYSNGAVIELPAGTFAVAEACAGLRFLVAAIAFGVFFSIITYRSWWRRGAFIALSVVVPVIANGFRALGLLVAAEWVGNPTAVLADHLIYGWVFFSIVLLLLIVAGQFFSDRPDEKIALSLPRSPVIANRTSPYYVVVISAACIMAAAAGPIAAALLPVARSPALPEVPPQVGAPWHEIQTDPTWKPIVDNPEQSFLQTFFDGSYRLDRFVALYSDRGGGGKLVSSNNRDANEHVWSYNSDRPVELKVNGRVLPSRVSTWLRGSQKRLVWSFYVVSGQFAAEGWKAKWDVFLARLTGKNCASAYVAISTVDTEGLPATKAVEGLLSATSSLDSYLCRPTKSR